MNSGTIESSLDTRIRAAIEILLNDLTVAKQGHSHWSGNLSDSALSTATAISALSVCRQTTGTDRFDLMILVQHCNDSSRPSGVGISGTYTTIL